MIANDVEGVRRVLALYCQLMDDGRYDEVAQLFDPEGRWTVMGKTYAGVDEIRGLMSSWPSPAGTKHLTVNSIIDIDGELAAAVSDFVVVQGTEVGGVVHRSGRYHDTLRRDSSGRWMFLARDNRGSSLVGG